MPKTVFHIALRPFTALLLAGALPACAGGTMRADTHTRMPMMGIMTSEGDATEWVNPQMKRSDADMKIDGPMAAFAHRLGGKSITIVRLDKGVVWRLKPDDMTYTETPIKPLEESKEAAMGRRGGPGKVRITDAGVTVKATGEKRVINQWPCTLYTVNGFLEFEEVEKHRKFRWVMSTELWNTPEMPLLKRYHNAQSEFGRNYMAKQGVTMGGGAMTHMGFDMLGKLAGASGSDLSGGLAKMTGEMQKISGVAIFTHYVWKMEGGDEEAEKKSRRGGPGGMVIEGETEIKAMKDEETSFDIPAGYKKED
jgi:hypothetical protein